jgi:nucleoside-diphosphate-sugar epimerase
MNHLVTGGSGFLGNLVARRLHARGEKVRILDIWEDPTRPPEIEFVNCDILDRTGVARAMNGIDVVHHNVALVPLTKAGKRFQEVNVDGSRIAAEEAVRARVKSFIHMSSSAVFGAPKQCPIAADTPTGPIEIYGRAKLAGEQAVLKVCREAGLPHVVIRPRTIIGEGRLGIFQILFEWISEGRNVYVIGDGNVKFQFVHAHDLMDAYLRVLDSGATGVFNIGAAEYGTLREALEHLIIHAGTKSKVKSLPAGPAIGALRLLDLLSLSPLAPWHYLTYHKAFYFDLEPILKLGWQPRYSNDAMLRESYDSFLRDRARVDAAAGSAHRKPVKERILGLLKKLS